MLGNRGIAPPILTSAQGRGEWSASDFCRFTPGERAIITHWIGGWVGPRAGLDAVEKTKISPLPESNLDPPAPYPVTITSRLLIYKKSKAIPVTGREGP
jgi:hypothetical protein